MNKYHLSIRYYLIVCSNCSWGSMNNSGSYYSEQTFYGPSRDITSKCQPTGQIHGV